jgi:hypothetical protein
MYDMNVMKRYKAYHRVIIIHKKKRLKSAPGYQETEHHNINLGKSTAGDEYILFFFNNHRN